MSEYKTITADKLFTLDEIEAGLKIIRSSNTTAHTRLRDEIVVLVMERINKSTGQENDVDYMAYLLEYLCNRFAHLC